MSGDIINQPARLDLLIPQLIGGAPLSDDQVLALTRTLRIEAIRDLFKNGTLSGESSDRNLFVALTGALDTQAINNKKIAAEDRAGSSNAALVAQIIAAIKPADFQNIGGAGGVVDVEAKKLPEGIHVDLVPGETEVNPGQLNYDTFVAANSAPGSAPPKQLED